MDWTPLNDNVLLQELEKLPELYRCRVLAIGEGMVGYNGIRVPCGVSVGDIVIVSRHVCQRVFKDKEQMLLCRAHQLRLKADSGGPGGLICSRD